MKYLIWGMVVIILVTLIHQALQFKKRVKIGRELAQNTQAFFHPAANAALKVLIVGDSTAVGTGASSPEYSIAGRFLTEFPNASIVNTGRNGAKLEEIHHQLITVDGTYDFVLIQGGANDIIYFTARTQAKKDLAEVLLAAKEKSSNIVLITSGNIGAAPIFPKPLGWLLTYRARVYLNDFREIADAHQVPMVDLFVSRKEDPFIAEPEKWYAEDLLHLSDNGYEVWYQKIRETMNANEIHLINKQ